MLDDLLVGDAEKPGSELCRIPQSVDVTRGIDESFLHEIEARLFIVDHFKHIHIERHLIADEQGIPGLRVSGPGLGYGQLFHMSTISIFPQVECSGREKVQRMRSLFPGVSPDTSEWA